MARAFAEIIDAGGLCCRFSLRFLQKLRSQRLGAAHREPLFDDGFRRGELHLRIAERQQRACVAGRERPVLDELQDLLRQRQQPRRIGDGGARLAHALRHIILRHAVHVLQGAVAFGLFDGVQVLALQVFDQRHLHGALLVGREDAHRHLLEPGHTAGAPAALARDDLIKAAVKRPHRDRLDEPVGTDGLGEQLQRLGIKALARLVGARLDLFDRQQIRRRLLALGLRGRIFLPEQCPEPHAETFLPVFTHVPPPMRPLPQLPAPPSPLFPRA